VRINDNPMLRDVIFPPRPLGAAGVEIQRNPRLAELSMLLKCSPFWYTIADSPDLQRLPVSVREPASQFSLLCTDDRTQSYSIVGVPSLRDLTELPRATVLAQLDIRGNTGLIGLDGLEELGHVLELVVDGNPKLESLAGLDPAMGGGLRIVETVFAVLNNVTLDQCDVDILAESLLAQNTELTLDVEGNGGGCQ
ncbi:MAG: hypothetical protein IAG13_08555, partial [Deltaproteobacteria bacterium]|nr:hypothetical protein [Nannocystaceae bacterium]